jgi:enoyl-CoA hydratase/carnithine racemase
MSIVFTEDRGAVRHVVLNRPEKRNAMNQELLHALRGSLRSAAEDESVQCVVLRGEGRVFSAGVDLLELAQSAGRAGPLRPFREVFLECANLCEEMTKPVVCAIHRACFGGALEVALGCDLRIASSDSQLGLPEVRFGIIPDVGGSTRLPAVVGLGRAKELIMTARTIGAVEAERIGLLNRVVEPHELADATQALVDELLANSAIAVGRAKRVMDASARPALATTLEMEVAVQEYCMAVAAMNGASEKAEQAPAGDQQGVPLDTPQSGASYTPQPRAADTPAPRVAGREALLVSAAQRPQHAETQPPAPAEAQRPQHAEEQHPTEPAPELAQPALPERPHDEFRRFVTR